MKKYHIEIRRILMVTFATFLYAVGVGYFLVPADLLTGGITGFSLIARRLLLEGNIDVNIGLMIFVLNIPVLIIGLKGVSRKFFYYTMYSIILQSLFLGFFSRNVSLFPNDILADAIFSGLFIGAGAGIALRAGASLGGMDVISQFLSLRKKTSVGMINLTSNGLILIMSIVFFSPSVALYTLVGYITSNILLDRIHTGYKRVKVEIITNMGELVKEKLLKSYEHGITMYDAIGAYSNTHKKVLTMVTQSHEVYDVKKSVISIDQDAFITITPIRHLSGKFNQIIIK